MRPGIDRHRACGKAGGLGKLVKPPDVGPHPRVNRTVAHQHPFQLQRQRAQCARHDHRQVLAECGTAGLRGFEAGHTFKIGFTQRLPERVAAGPQPVFLEFLLSRRRKIILGQLALVIFCSGVKQINVLEQAVDLEGLGVPQALQPLRDFGQGLQRICRQFGNDLPGLFDIGHLVINLVSGQKTEHGIPLNTAVDPNRNRRCFLKIIFKFRPDRPAAPHCARVRHQSLSAAAGPRQNKHPSATSPAGDHQRSATTPHRSSADRGWTNI